jgi:branched-subunit amino acid aminotransferase/4-amino-4-deoxychorismate lyase
VRNERGDLAEGTASNVFWIRAGEIRTPSLECGILPGVARALLLRAARRLGLRVRTGRFGVADLLESEEAFLSNALVLAVPLIAVDGRRLSTRGRRAILPRLRAEAIRLRRSPPGDPRAPRRFTRSP